MHAPYRTLSEHRPLRRNYSEKTRQLRDLREALTQLKPQTSPALRESIRRRIYELTSELQDIPQLDQPVRRRNRRYRVYALYSD